MATNVDGEQLGNGGNNQVPYIIEKDVPFPNFGSYTATARFPLDDMEVGDSFEMPYEERKRFTAATSRRRKLGDEKAFCYRRISLTRIRVWRTK